jgi:hypothetical protein
VPADPRSALPLTTPAGTACHPAFARVNGSCVPCDRLGFTRAHMRSTAPGQGHTCVCPPAHTFSDGRCGFPTAVTLNIPGVPAASGRFTLLGFQRTAVLTTAGGSAAVPADTFPDDPDAAASIAVSPVYRLTTAAAAARRMVEADADDALATAGATAVLLQFSPTSAQWEVVQTTAAAATAAVSLVGASADLTTAATAPSSSSSAAVLAFIPTATAAAALPTGNVSWSVFDATAGSFAAAPAAQVAVPADAQPASDGGSTTTPPPAGGRSGDDSPTSAGVGAIAGGVVGAVAGAALLIALALWLRGRGGSGSKRSPFKGRDARVSDEPAGPPAAAGGDNAWSRVEVKAAGTAGAVAV